MDEIVHWAGLDQSPCGVKTMPGLPRTSVLREVTCETCRDQVCLACEGSGLHLDRKGNVVVLDGDYPLTFQKCKACRGSRLKPVF